MLNRELRQRIINNKFRQALVYLDTEVTLEQEELIRSLARLLGDCGWTDGDLGAIVSYTTDKLLSEGI